MFEELSQANERLIATHPWPEVRAVSALITNVCNGNIAGDESMLPFLDNFFDVFRKSLYDMKSCSNSEDKTTVAILVDSIARSLMKMSDFVAANHDIAVEVFSVGTDFSDFSALCVDDHPWPEIKLFWNSPAIDTTGALNIISALYNIDYYLNLTTAVVNKLDYEHQEFDTRHLIPVSFMLKQMGEVFKSVYVCIVSVAVAQSLATKYQN